MKFLKWLANLVLGLVIVMTGVNFVFSLCVAWFKLNGSLSEGQPMYRDLMTPTWPGLLAGLALSGALMGVAIYLRARVNRTA
ncbi:MAG TPA: hypothetical protein VLJ58_14605 [Ramlibacter sp.]|nr:hypothetical protein [Ramlibacter sp.]